MNVIREVKSDRVGDRYYEVKHPSGLRIFVYPKEQNNSTYAVFGTRYGSVDTTFKRSDEAEACTVPAGIIIWSTSFLRARTGMRLHGMPRPVRTPMHILRLM